MAPGGSLPGAIPPFPIPGVVLLPPVRRAELPRDFLKLRRSEQTQVAVFIGVAAERAIGDVSVA